MARLAANPDSQVSISDRQGGADDLLAVSSSGNRAIISSIIAIILSGLLLLACGEKGLTVKVESVVPTDEVVQTGNFTILFSHDLAPDSLIGVRLDSLPVAIEPSLPGKFAWIAPNKLRFYPDLMLAPSTRYQMEMKAQLTSQYGYQLKGDRWFEFHTPRLRVNSASLLFDFIPDTNKKVNLAATVEFSYDVDPREAARYLSLRYESGGTIPIEFTTDTVANIIAFKAYDVPRGKEEKQLEIKVAKGLKCIGGNLPLEYDYHQPVTLPGQEDLKVEGVRPVRVSPTTDYIRIEFNLPVNTDQAQRHIKIEPEIDYRLYATHHYLDLKGNFAADTTYQVTLNQSLTAIDGSPLRRTFSTAVIFRKVDIPPQIDFVGDGFYLTRSGNLNLGLSTINVSEAEIKVEKVFVNNLIYLLNSADLATDNRYYHPLKILGKEVNDTVVDINKVDNQEVVTPISVRDCLGNDPGGIYRFMARSGDTRWRWATRWVIATDMGIMAKQSDDQLWVSLNSLSTLEPIKGAEIKLFSRNNQLLLTGRTDSEGICVFEPFQEPTAGFEPYLVTASSGDDLSFLELTRREIPVSSFDVGGRSPRKGGYDAFLYKERGVYRPGEIAHLAALVRGKNLSIPSPFPLKLKITTPDNKILSEQRARFDDQGAVQFKVAIPSYARTGRYTAILTIGDNEEIGRTSFSVEEFIPDRMKVKLTTERDAYYAGENLKIDVEAVTLFGPPAARRQVDVSIEIEAFPFAPPAYKGFIFADGRKSFSRQEFKLGRQVLDDEGKRTYEYTIPDKFKPPSALRGIIAATVMEPGGRGVSAYKVVKIHPYDAYVGLRRLDKGYSGVNQENRIEFVLTSPEGRTVSGRKLEVSFYYVYWHSILRQAGRRQGYRYVSEEVEELQQRFTIDSHDDVASFSVTPEHYGRYRVVVCDVASGASASLWFYASGWGYSPWAMDNPDKVELDLDRESYLPGEKAQLQVRAPFPGKLLITIESDQVMEYQIATLEENTATLTIPVTAQFKPNVYIAVHLIRSTEKLKRDTPVRAFGVVPLMVDCEDQRLKVELDAPAEIRPCRELTVNFQVKGLTENTASVTIAAVDEGICQLTDFRTPNPHAHFLGKERLAVATHDIYSIILPEIESSSSSSSGDVEAARKRHLTPVSIKRVKPVSFWSGLIRTDAQGAGSVSFPIPQFSGTIRLMAVATCGNRFGNSEKKVIVRQPIELTPTFPRFLAGGDRFVIPVSVFNNTGSESTFEVSLQVSGPAKLTGDEAQKIKIASGREEMVHFNLEAGEGAGKIAFKLTASGNGERSEISVEVPLRPPVPFITLSGSGSIEEASPAIFTLPDDWLEGTVEFQLALSSFPAVKFARSLQYLLSYPHGCLEQTTSRLFPLLYFNDLARLAEPELFDRNSADYYIEEGITRLENMQLPSGAFSFWPGGSYTNDWSSLYATHFLIEARLAGYVVPDRVYDRMIEALDDYARDHGNGNREEYQTVAYACYLLSRTEKPDRSTMNFLRSLKRDKLSNYSRYQLAGAYAFAGDMATARTFLPRAAAPLSSKEERQTGGNFNSSVRTCAIMLDILAQVDPKNPMVPLLVQEVTASAAGRGCWYTTQENAFALLALGKIMRQQTEEDYRGHVVITGEEVLTFDTRSQSLSSGEWAGREVTIELTGKGTCYYYWRADGIPLNRDIDEYDHDLRVRRRYLDEEGNPLDHADFKQGDMLVAEITVKATAGAIANVAIVDLLPAGLEIENPRLQSRRSLKWIKAKARPAYIDFRDDRMILYTNLSHNGECKFYYSLRAVTQGDFVLPPICAEAMYAPMKASVAGSGRIKVVR